jgi:hypothetical protein
MRTRQSVCNRKARFPGEAEARAAAAASSLPLLPYRCDRCRLFHLTSRTKGKFQRGSGSGDRPGRDSGA